MDLNKESFWSFPVEFQKDFVGEIFKRLSHGESIYLYGPAGSGKTTLIENLVKNEAVRKHHLPNREILFCLYNGDQLELGLLDPARLHQELIASLNEKDRPVVVIIDHLDRLNREHFLPLFSALKSFRETARHRIGFLIAANSDLPNLAGIEHFEPIKPLLYDNRLLIPALNFSDARLFLERLTTLHETKINKAAARKIFLAGGGFPRLMKRLLKLSTDKAIDFDKIMENPALDEGLGLTLKEIARFLVLHPKAEYKIPLLQKISLSASKQDSLGQIRFQSPLTKQEYKMAEILIKNKGELVSREEMITAVWPKNSYETSEHALDQMLHRLRRKLEKAEPQTKLTTLRGRGCRLEI